MDWILIEARWPEYRASAKREWDKLSEEQLSGTRGNRAYVVKRVQEAYGISAQEAERRVAQWQDKQFERFSRAANSP